MPKAKPKLKWRAGSLHRIVRLRERTEKSLHHWKRILEDAEEFRGTKQVASAKEQIVWMRGYLRALDDVMQANARTERPEAE